MPGPKRKSFLFGHFFDVVKAAFMGPHSQWIAAIRSETGTVPSMISYSSLFGNWTVLVLDCAVVKDILMAPAAKEPLRFEKKYDLLRYLIGNGLVVLEGSDWSRHRRIIQPCFQPKTLKNSVSRASIDFTERLMAAWTKASGRVIDASSHMQALTLDIIGEIAFSYKFNGLNEIEKWSLTIGCKQLGEVSDPMVQSLKASFKISPLGVFLRICGLSSWYLVLDQKAKQSSKLLTQAANDILQHAKREVSSTPKERKSLLQQLLHANNVGPSGDEQNTRNWLTEEELRSEITSFIVAGHETTSTWCYWALYALGRFPSVQENLFAEISSSSPDSNESITLNEIEEMQYFSGFLNETLRLYSPVGMVVRRSTRDEHWNGFSIPRGTRLVIPIHLLHRHPDHWADPETFSPERWFDAEATAARDKFAFLPFSFGPRNCIGYRFAEIEAKIIIANIVKKFRIDLVQPVDDEELAFANFIALKSKPPVEIKAYRRNDSD